MPKPSQDSKHEIADVSVPKSTLVVGSAPVTKPAVAAPAAPRAPKPRYVLVESKMRQTLTLSVLNDDGIAVELKLAPLATSTPIREDCLTDQIRRFAASGQVRIR